MRFRLHRASPPGAAAPPRINLWGGAGLVVATLTVYVNSLAGPFIFDDQRSIPGNPPLRSPLAALAPPRDGPMVSGRPALNLSFALNHAVGGDHAWSHHLARLRIHLLAGLVLFGIVSCRRGNVWNASSSVHKNVSLTPAPATDRPPATR